VATAVFNLQSTEKAAARRSLISELCLAAYNIHRLEKPVFVKIYQGISWALKDENN
jgi:hypothetical protein